MKRKILFLVLILFLLNYLFAQTATSSKTPVQIKAQRVSYDWGKKMSKAEGNVVVTYKPGKEDETKIFAPVVFYNQDASLVEVQGKVTITRRDLNITGEDLKADLRKEEVELKKNVVIVIQRKVEGGRTETTKLTSQTLKYSLRTSTGTLSGGVNIDREDLKARSDSASVDTDKEIYILIDNVSMLDSDRNEIKCKKLNVYVREKKVEAEGDVESIFYITE
ncbi:MAG: LPS export ABC transporter periplasmic protein LptC [Dictyoglomus sp.]|nr:LPS export ABC transporter periplasmic protein LptC [Dictyoglomus sp.]MCX7845623.1 LPS export ABC transporter periplasmic protein LptC [Dictyoglomaceae bacterium]MDW8189118.1 LPS export ABC transporter periplasmic protein LptC [Dictyoglomus sp.]